jgi:hypothetical protein
VANEAQIILAADVTDQTNDKRQAAPMMDQARANLDAAGVEQAIGAGLMDSGDVREAPGDHRADLWPVETGAGIPSVRTAGPGVDARRMSVEAHGLQPAEAVAA